MKITYQLRSKAEKCVPIYLRLYSPADLKLKTGLFVHPKDWSKDKGQAIGRNPQLKNLNARLAQLTSHIIAEVNASSEVKDKAFFKRIIAGFSNPVKEDTDQVIPFLEKLIESAPYRKYRGRVGLSKGTVKNYRVFKNNLLDFYYERGENLHFSRLDKAFFDRFTRWMLETKKYSENYTGRQIVRLKTIVREAGEAGISIPPSALTVKGFTQAKQERIIITLTQEEIEAVKGVKLSSAYLENARALFLIGLYSGLRVSDLLSLQPSQVLSHPSGAIFLDVLQKKTGKQVIVPIVDQVVIDILKNGHWRTISDIKFNKYIKQVCYQAGINTPTKGDKYNGHTKRKERGIYPKCELISSHAMRRTFITLNYNKIPSQLLRAVSGHSSESQMLHYVGQSDKHADAEAFLKALQHSK